jgi:type II secretion system protein N
MSNGAAPTNNETPLADAAAGGGRFTALTDLARRVGPPIGWTTLFVTSFLLFAYWSFPWDRVRDRIVADFERGQRPPPGAPRQHLSIGKLEPSWLTGVVLKDVVLTTVPADPSKPESRMVADEVKARVSFGSLFSAAKDVTISSKAMGGTIEVSITHKPAAEIPNAPPPRPGQKPDPLAKYDRTLHVELDNVSLNELAPLRDAVGAPIGGTMRGSIDLTFPQNRSDKANGTIALDVDGFWISDGKTPFKIPDLKAVFGTDEITLPQIKIGALPIQIEVKNGVAKVQKMEAKGADIDLVVDGQLTLRDPTPESDVALGLRFKFNDSYKKKGEATAGLLMLVDSVPKLRQGKRPDGMYGLRLVGLLGANLQTIPAPNGVPTQPMMPGGHATPPGLPGVPPPAH